MNVGYAHTIPWLQHQNSQQSLSLSVLFLENFQIF